MQFLYPNVFYMMLIPLILLIVLILTNKDGMDRYFSKNILKKLAVGGKSLDKNTRNGLFFFTLILFIVALSRPVINLKEQDLKQNLIPIVIALDVSKSMMATDIYPNRISLAKKKLKQVINLSKNSTIGIVLFAKDSFILSPVTEDFISLNYIIERLDTNVDFVNGSNIEAVLEATSHMLEDFKVKNLIILSDGGNNKEYKEALEFAKEEDIVIYSVGLATKTGSPIPAQNGYMTDENGNIVTVKLNESIKKLTLNSGGGYIDFTLDNSDIEAIISKINQDSQKEEMKSQKIKTYTELFYFPLGFGLFVLLLALSSTPTFKKSKKVNLIIFLSAFIFTAEQSKASLFEFENIKNGNEYYQKKEFTKAADEYRQITQTPQSFYNLANSLYKDKKYKEAIDTYSKIVTDDINLEYQKLHNIGNSFVMSNQLEKAKEFYEKALNLKNDKETKENLDMVNKELEKMKKDENKNQDNKKKQENDEKKQDNKKKQENDEKKEQQENKKENKKNKEKAGDGKPSEKKPQQNISDMEEKKWMKMLNEKQTPILLQKVETQKGANDESQPW